MADDPPLPAAPPAEEMLPSWPAGPRDDAPPPPHPGFFTAVLWCLLFLIVTQLLPAVGVLMSAFAYLVAREDGLRPALDFLATLQPDEVARPLLIPLVVTSQTVAVLFPLLVIRLAVGPGWRRQLALRAPRPLHVFLTGLTLPAVLVLAAGATAVARRYLPSIGELLPPLTGPEGESAPLMEQMVELFGTWPLWLSVLFIGVCPGVGEELWCRGFLGRGLVGRYGVVAGVVLTSLLFGAIHVDPQQGAMAALMGLILHYLYLTTRSLWAPILLHFLNNSVAVAAAHFQSSLALLDREPESVPLPVYAGAAVLLAGVVWALYATRARLTAADGGPPPWLPPYPGVALPPPGSETEVR